MRSASSEEALLQAIARQEALLEQLDKTRNEATFELANLQEKRGELIFRQRK